MVLRHVISLWPGNIWTWNSQTVELGGVDPLHGLQGLQIWPVWLLSLGYLKDQVFCELPSTIPELKTTIRQAISSITAETLEKVYKNIKFRNSFVIRQNGGHFENLLNLQKTYAQGLSIAPQLITIAPIMN